MKKFTPKNKSEINISKDEAQYLVNLLREEVFKLEGVTKVLKKPIYKKTLKLAADLQEKISSVDIPSPANIRVSSN